MARERSQVQARPLPLGAEERGDEDEGAQRGTAELRQRNHQIHVKMAGFEAAASVAE